MGVIELIAIAVVFMLLTGWSLFGLVVLVSKLKAKPNKKKYEVISLGGVYWVIKIVDKPKYYNHKTRDFNNLKFASKYDSYQLAYLNMNQLK